MNKELAQWWAEYQHWYYELPGYGAIAWCVLCGAGGLLLSYAVFRMLIWLVWGDDL